MRSRKNQSLWAIVLSVCLFSGGYAPGALAGFIGAQDLSRSTVEAEQGLRQSVTERLIGLGVAPSLAQQRIAALTRAELQQLDQKLDELPAGAGALEVIGIVFLVLLILELVGITNVFSKI